MTGPWTVWASGASWKRRGWRLVFLGLWAYTLAHYLRAVLGYHGYYDFFVLLDGTHEWLALHRFPIGYWYPPFFFLWNMWLARFDYFTATMIMLGINHCLVPVCFAMLAVLLAGLAPRRVWWWVLLPLVLNFRPLLTILSMAKIEMAQMALLLAGLLAVQRKREWLGGGLVALAGMLKPLPILFLLYFAWTRQWRAIRGWAVVAAISLLLSGVFVGFDAVWNYFSMIVQPRGDNAVYWYEDQSVAGVVARLLHPLRPAHVLFIPPAQVPWTSLAAAWMVRLLVMGWMALLLGRRQERSPQRLWGEWSIVSAGILLLSPLSRDYYAVFLVPGYVLLAAVVWQRGVRRAAAACWWGIGSYLLVGQGFPLGVIHHLPTLVTGISNFQLYFYYGLPMLGYVCFIAAWAAFWRQERREWPARVPTRDAAFPAEAVVCP